MTVLWHDIAGYLGVLLVLGAFFLLQARRLDGNGATYQLMNIVGALGVTASLLFGSFNWPAFLMQMAWIAIGIYGLVRGRAFRAD